MSIIESYASSVSAGNISDVMGAFAMSHDNLATSLLRLKYCNDASVYYRILDELEYRLTCTNSRQVARKALGYYINPVCRTCQGRDTHPHDNEKGVREIECKHCHGSGEQGTDNLSEDVKATISLLESIERVAASGAKKRLYTPCVINNVYYT